MTHFVGCTKSPNVPNSSYNRKKIGNTSEARPTMYISFANKGKTQVGWVTTIGKRAQKWANTNNIPPKGSPCHVPNSNEMTMKSSCQKVSKKYNGDGHA
jgi:hypothetical protein